MEPMLAFGCQVYLAYGLFTKSHISKKIYDGGFKMEDPVLLGILIFGFFVTSALCKNFIDLRGDLDLKGNRSKKVY